MKEITIDGLTYFKTELGYAPYEGGKTVIAIYTSNPGDIDLMINKLVDFKVKQVAEDRLKSLISEKVGHFLALK